MDLGEKLELLRSAVKSSSVNKASIVVDASRYIKELKERVQKLNQQDPDHVVQPQPTTSNQTNSLPAMVKIETVEKGFQINVFSEKNCPGLLESILEAFEELGLEVLDARVSCSDNFHLEALSENEGQSSESIDAQVVKGAVLEAIRSWSQKNIHQSV